MEDKNRYLTILSLFDRQQATQEALGNISQAAQILAQNWSEHLIPVFAEMAKVLRPCYLPYLKSRNKAKEAGVEDWATNERYRMLARRNSLLARILPSWIIWQIPWEYLEEYKGGK